MSTTALIVFNARPIRGRVTRHSHPPLARYMRAIECVQCDWEERQATDAAERRRMNTREENRYGRRDEEFWLGPDHAIPITRDANFRTCNFCEKPVRDIRYYERRRPWVYRGERIHTLIAWSHTRCARAEDPTHTPL